MPRWGKVDSNASSADLQDVQGDVRRIGHLTFAVKSLAVASGGSDPSLNAGS